MAENRENLELEQEITTEKEKIGVRQIFLLVFHGICLVISGLGIGWLMGLSASPVVATVLASLLTIVVGNDKDVRIMRAALEELLCSKVAQKP